MTWKMFIIGHLYYAKLTWSVPNCLLYQFFLWACPNPSLVFMFNRTKHSALHRLVITDWKPWIVNGPCLKFAWKESLYIPYKFVPDMIYGNDVRRRRIIQISQWPEKCLLFAGSMDPSEMYVKTNLIWTWLAALSICVAGSSWWSQSAQVFMLNSSHNTLHSESAIAHYKIWINLCPSYG